MPSYMLRDLPSDLWGQVKAQATTEDVSLRAMVLDLLRRGLAVTASGAKGGHARAQSLTPDQRRESAVRAARARWGPQRP